MQELAPLDINSAKFAGTDSYSIQAMYEKGVVIVRSPDGHVSITHVTTPADVREEHAIIERAIELVPPDSDMVITGSKFLGRITNDLIVHLPSNVTKTLRNDRIKLIV